MSSPKQWYAVYTRPRLEKKVTDALLKRKFEAYCPTKQVTQEWLGRKKQVQEPLIPSFVFVRAIELEFGALKNIDGVLNMVFWMGKPAVIRDVEIHMMRQFLEDHDTVKLERAEVNADNIVRIVKDKITEIGKGAHEIHKEVFSLVLPSLGFALVAETIAPTIVFVGANETLDHNNIEKVYAIR